MAIVVAAGCLTESASAQSGLKRVDQGVADAGPLSTGRVQLWNDLRSPTGFDQVYSFQSQNAFGGGQTFMMRQSGALTAVFPRSEYIGGRATVPAGTVFYFGTPPELVNRRPDDYVPPPPTKIDTAMRTGLSMGSQTQRLSLLSSQRVDGQVVPENMTLSPPTWGRIRPDPSGIWTDERYRVERVSSLLQSAMTAPK